MVHRGYSPTMKTRWSGPVIVGSLLSLVASLAACSAPSPKPSPASSSDPYLRLVTVHAPQNSAMDAAFTGTLTVDGDGCVQAHSGDESSVYTLAWPQGYTVQGDLKAFEIFDANKNVVARSGSPFTVGGGLIDSPRESWTERDCAKGQLWLVAPPDF